MKQAPGLLNKPAQLVHKTSPITAINEPNRFLGIQNLLPEDSYFKRTKRTHGNNIKLAEFCWKTVDLATLLEKHLSKFPRT